MTGWWGPNPPYHNDVFVHTHHLRPPLGGHGGRDDLPFLTDEPIETVRARALEAAGGKGRPDRRRTGHPVQQYLRAGLIDELHLAIVPPHRAGASVCSTTSGRRGIRAGGGGQGPGVTHRPA